MTTTFFQTLGSSSRLLELFWVDGEGDLGDLIGTWHPSLDPDLTPTTVDISDAPVGSTPTLLARATACGHPDEAVERKITLDPGGNGTRGSDPHGYPIFSGDPSDDECDENNTFFPSGNATYPDLDPLPGPGGKRQYNSRNEEIGYFGKGWSSMFDSRVELLGGGEELRIILENGFSVYFKNENWGWEQWWPAEPHGTLDVDVGSGTYTYRDPSGRVTRTYADSANKHLISRFSEFSQTGFDIIWGVGGPSEVQDQDLRWTWSVTTINDRIEAISYTSNQVTTNVGYDYSLDRQVLTGTSVNLQSLRSYAYSGGPNQDLLSSVHDGVSYSLASFDYEEFDQLWLGWVTSVQTTNGVSYEIEYDIEPTSPRPLVDGEYAVQVVRTDAPDIFETLYYIRPMARGPDKTVQTEGFCSCSGVSAQSVSFYDVIGRRIRTQDARGFVTERSYDPWNRLVEEWRGINPNGCQPGTPDATPQISPESLESLVLNHNCALEHRQYQYNSLEWPYHVTKTKEISLLDPAKTTFRSLTLDSATGTPLESIHSGLTVNSLNEIERQNRTTSTTLYSGTEPSAFDPSAFAPSGVNLAVNWQVVASDPQPFGLPKVQNWPLAENGGSDDITQFVYYPLTVNPPELRGRLAATMNPMGGVTIYDGYDAFGNVTRMIDPHGVVTESTYDALGRIVTTTVKAQPSCDTTLDPLCNQDIVVRTNTYASGIGPLEGSVGPDNSSETIYSYDTEGRVSEIQRGPVGNPVEATKYLNRDPIWGHHRREETLGKNSGGTWEVKRWVEFEYDGQGQLESTTRPTNSGDAVETYSYDATGNISTFTDANHPSPNVEYTYDGLGRMVSVKTLLEDSPETWAETLYAYDSHGNLKAVTDATGLTTTYTIDDFGQTVQIVSPATGTTEIAYDLAGRKTWKEDARGSVETTEYDWNGMPTSVETTLNTETQTITVGYDSSGRRTSATSLGSGLTESWEYTRQGQIARYTRDNVVLSMLYNASGAMTFYGSDPGVEGANITPDWAGRPVGLTFDHPSLSGTKTVIGKTSYLPNGPIEHLILGPKQADRLFEHTDFDGRYLPTDHQVAQVLSGVTTDLYLRTRVFDAVGNLTDITDGLNPARLWAFDYDDGGRLIDADVPGNKVDGVGYAYDDVGNRTNRTIHYASGLEDIEDYTFDPSSGLLSTIVKTLGVDPPFTETIAHDLAGNLVDDAAAQYSYNPDGTMNKQHFGTVTPYVGYSFDAGGRRAITVSNSGFGPINLEHHNLLPDGRPWKVVSPTDTTWHLWLGSRLVATFNVSDGLRFVIGDHLGYPEMVINETGTATWTADHLPFGQLYQKSGTDDPGLRYPGQWTIPQAKDFGFPEFYYNHHRWYVPGWGRYSQSDPIGLRGGMNLFSYAAGNPLRFIDPSGLQLVMPPPSSIFPLPGCTVSGPWIPMPESAEREYVRTRGNWVRVGRGVPIWRPAVPGAGVVGFRPGTAPVQSGGCWCIWKRRPGIVDIWRTVLWWKRQNCCPPGVYRNQYHSKEFESEVPGEVMYSPGSYNVTRTKGIWNATVGCTSCPEPQL